MPKPIEDTLWVVEVHVVYEYSQVLELVAGPPVAVRKYVLKHYGRENASFEDFEYNAGPSHAPTSFTLYQTDKGDYITLTLTPITDLLKGKR